MIPITYDESFVASTESGLEHARHTLGAINPFKVAVTKYLLKITRADQSRRFLRISVPCHYPGNPERERDSLGKGVARERERES